MNVESRVLNLFLHQQSEGKKFKILMAYNYTTKRVFSWRQSLLFGGSFGSGITNLGLKHTPELISKSIREEVEKMSPLFLINSIDLHNEGDYEGGEKDRLPEPLYHHIQSFLNSKPIKICDKYKANLVIRRS